MSAAKSALLERLRGGLIVSCQVAPDEPMFLRGDRDGRATSADTSAAAAFARAAAWGGAVGIRANSPAQIRAIREAVDLPVIGIHKIVTPDTEVYITPTLKAARAVWEAGAHIIALDCTERQVGKKYAYALLPVLKRKFPDALLMADVSTFFEALNAVELGADIVAPTLYGHTKYTKYRPPAVEFYTREGFPIYGDTLTPHPPNMNLLWRMCRELQPQACVFMEGGIRTPDQAAESLRIGAHAVVVGSAITRPHLITQHFAKAMAMAPPPVEPHATL